MRKYFALNLICVVSLILISWGGIGHKTVATIAYNHLTPQAKAAVKELLGDQSMADVASWADEIRMNPQFKYTTPRHYINVPLGLSYTTFIDSVTGQSSDNIYKAIVQCERDLQIATTSREQKAIALKYLIHFIGDMHQPMHVSRSEDQGGNTIQVQYQGKGSNLHSVWDSKLIGTEGKSFEQMSVDYDTATEKQIKQWQSDPLVKWLWESYRITTNLYIEIEHNNKLDEGYYNSHINIVHERVEMAGIRLAGVLNTIFENYKTGKTKPFKPVSIGATDQEIKSDVRADPNPDAYLNAKASVSGDKTNRPRPVTIYVQDAPKYIDRYVEFTARVVTHKVTKSTTLLNIGADYPKQRLTIVLKGLAKSKMDNIIKAVDGKVILAEGVVSIFKGKPEVLIRDSLYIDLLGKW